MSETPLLAPLNFKLVAEPVERSSGCQKDGGNTVHQFLSSSFDQFASGVSELSLITGFPGPVSYAEQQPRPPQSSAWRPSRGDHVFQFYGQDVQPVFRSAPFAAEELRRGAQRTAAHILFLDEGNCCRSVMAEAMFSRVLDRLRAGGVPLDARAESASLGPPLPEPDARVARLAREAGLTLPPRRRRCFDEVQDVVAFDLVLVMDKFDHEEVLREVSVLDTINPGGFYSARVRQLGHFAAASPSFRPEKAPWASGDGISDPLYGNVGGQAEQAALWGTLRKLRVACAGLAQYLAQLQAGCAPGTTLQQALSMALMCPLLDAEALCGTGSPPWAAPNKGTDWRPVWRAPDAQGAAGQLYSLRVVDGSTAIVKRPDPYYKVERGYWTDVENLRKEINGWMDRHGTMPGRLPTNRELRSSGANQICNAIEAHGGYFAVAKQLGLQTVQKTRQGYWIDPHNVQRELSAFARMRAASGRDETTMPSLQELRASGRPDLAYAVSKFGGVLKAAKLCGLDVELSRCKSPPAPQRRSLLGTQKLLWARFPQAMQLGKMPSRTELIDAGHRQLARQIGDLGGFKAVSAELGLQYVRAGRGTSKQSQSGGTDTPGSEC